MLSKNHMVSYHSYQIEIRAGYQTLIIVTKISRK